MLEIDEILKLEDINNYIYSLGKEEIKKLLIDDKIRDYYLNEFNINKCISLLEMLSDEEIIIFFDDKMIDKLLNSTSCNEIILKLLKPIYSDELINKIFDNQKIMDVIIKDYYLKRLLYNLHGDITEKLFNIIIEKNQLETMKYLNETDFLNLVKRDDVVGKLKSISDSNLLKYLPINVLNTVLKDSFFKYKLLNMDIEDIYYLTQDGIIFPNSFIYEEELINKYLSISNISVRRIYLKKLMNNNYSLYEVINSKLKKIYDENVFDGLIDEYNTIVRKSDSVELKKQIMSLYSDRCLQLLIDRYFEDYDGNILTNIYTIINFNKNFNIISNERIKYYDLIIHFNDYDINMQRKIYDIMPQDILVWLYEDFRMCQNKAYSLINDEIIDISKLKFKKESGISIYELSGEKFVLPVHTIERKRDDYVSWYKCAYKTLCLTLIGNESIGTYRNPKEYFVVGFKELNINNIMHVYHSDSFTDGEKSTNRINEIYAPHELLNKTKGYNEILILQNGHKSMPLKPDYVVCYDDVTDNDIMCAKNLGDIPIIKINTKYYNISKDVFDYQDNNYVKNINDLYNYEYKKSK